MNSKLIGLVLLVILAACSSRTLKKDYAVEDSSHQEIPEWIQDSDEWAQDNDEDDYKKNKYYTFTSEPKNSRVTACEIAKLRVNSEVASEVTQFIKHSLSTTTEGDSKDLDENLDEYMDETLTKEVQSYVIGAQTIKKYWEKRVFTKDLGAKKNISGFTCSVLVKISKKNMKQAFDMAFKKLKAKAKNYNLKQKIEKAKEDVNKEFL